MAQAGLYVPSSTFRFKPYNTIFTRILGNDNIFKGQSTFAVEMSEMRAILKRANSNSLILGDELCSGTEQPSAISIFGSGLKLLDNNQDNYYSYLDTDYLLGSIVYNDKIIIKDINLALKKADFMGLEIPSFFNSQDYKVS